MWFAIILAVLASGANNSGKALQRKGTKTLPQFSPDVQTITKYVKNKTWALGFLSDLAGSLLMVSALANAPVSVIQPVSGGGLVILSLLSHFVFLEKLKQGEWIAVMLTFGGIVGVGVAMGGVASVDANTTSLSAARIGLSLASCFCLIVFAANRVRQMGSKRGSGSRHFAAFCGVFSGCFFALSSTTCRSGFILGGITGRKILFGACGMGCSVVNTSIGFVYQTLGLKEGSAVMISTITTVVTMLLGMLLGILALGEGLPTSSGGLALHISSCILIAVGSVVLGNGNWDLFLELFDKAVGSNKVLLNMLPSKLRLQLQHYAAKLPVYASKGEDSK
mmetsp:Transcript_9914/g.25263  ORF Transcript_9914/g.25263 Transcript_9914/m.25263 type:complete len:336 (-) Transcript_9914:140-1147(-)